MIFQMAESGPVEPKQVMGISCDRAFQSFQACKACVKCYIEVENQSGVHLTHEYSFLTKGHIGSSPPDILPGKTEAFYAHGDSDSNQGSCGISSWIIDDNKDTPKRFVVMWSAPFSFNFYSNWLGTGIKESAVNESTFGKMYYNPETWFHRREYYKSCDELLYEDQGFKVRGSMGTNHTPVIKLRFSMSSV